MIDDGKFDQSGNLNSVLWNAVCNQAYVSLKSPLMKISFVVCCLVLLLSSCSKYGFVNLKYPNQPDVVLPDNVQRIAAIARTIPPKENAKGNVVEAILTGEVAGSDKAASIECINGFINQWGGFRNIVVVMPAKPKRLGSANTSSPEPLDWTTVSNICDSTQADALLVLEMFDSNSNLLENTINKGINDVLQGRAPTPPSQVRMNVNSYWRLYHPASASILDQYRYTHFLDFNMSSPLNVPPLDALPKTAFASGEQYANRYFPSFYYIKRDMYKRRKGRLKPQFLKGFRRSEVVDWNGAYSVWLEIANNSKRKNAGRACVNLAVACEVLDKNEEALSWANRSYEDYGNKMGRDYANKLRHRINLTR